MTRMNSCFKPIGLVGLIGLGLVGQALAQRLRSAGFSCIGYDVRADAMARFVESGQAVAASVAELAASAHTIVLAISPKAWPFWERRRWGAAHHHHRRRFKNAARRH